MTIAIEIKTQKDLYKSKKKKKEDKGIKRIGEKTNMLQVQKIANLIDFFFCNIGSCGFSFSSQIFFLTNCEAMR